MLKALQFNSVIDGTRHQKVKKKDEVKPPNPRLNAKETILIR